MYFVIFATDRPAHERVRDGERPRHHAYVRDPGLPVRVQVAGPIIDPESDTASGSLFIVEAEDMAAAESFVTDDPYSQAGLFETVVVRPFHWDLGRPEGA